MLFVDYLFSLTADQSILLDPELSPSSLQVKDGDKFVVEIGRDKRILLRKVRGDGRTQHSGTN